MAALSYEERKSAAVEAKRCQWSGCAESPAEGSRFCAEHWERDKEHKRNWAAARREEWSDDERCTDCGGQRSKGSVFCPACRMVRKRTPVVEKVVEKRATGRDYVEVDGYARLRGHGKGKRGAMSRSESDTYDLKQAQSSFVQGVKDLAYAYSDEVQEMPRIQRDGAKRQALSTLAHSARAIIDVLKRGGYPVRILVTDAENDEE